MAPRTNLRLVPSASTAEGATEPTEAESEAESSQPPPTPDQQRFVLSALPLIYKCAREIAGRFFGRVTPDELLGPGAIGADEAARKYDEDQHQDFLVYARQYIRYRMFDAIRREHTTLRARVERAMDRGFDRFTSHQAPEADSFSDAPEKVVHAAREGGHDALAAAYFAAVLGTHGASPEEVFAALEGELATLQALSDAIGKLLPLEREVIHLIYEETMFVDDVAKKVGKSPSTVQRRHASAIRKLRMQLVREGVTDPRLLDR